MNDVPRALRDHRRAISRACVAVVAIAFVLQVVDALGDDGSPWPAMGALYVSAAAIGLDAVVIGVRKRTGVGISIANLAPGGWAIFASMFWILAVPAYFFGARRRVGRDDDPREPVTWGSWASIVALAALGAVFGVYGTLAR